MKTKLFLSALCFFSVAMSYLPSGFAQTKDLPAGARARLGEKYRCSNIAGAVKSKWLITPVNYLWDFDYSPDGRFLVMADSYAYEGISLYDAKTTQKLRAGAAWSRIRNVVFSPDGKTIAAGREDGDIFLIDTATLSASPAKHRPRAPLSQPISLSYGSAWIVLPWRGRGCRGGE